MPNSSARVVYDAEGLNTGTWPDPVPPDILTPLESFFTRSHAAVPEVDPSTWHLEIGGRVERPQRLTLQDLREGFPWHHVTATLVCAGMRRVEFASVRPVPGELPWGPEAVSTGRWTGVALRDVLAQARVAPGARHVEFIGLDNVDRQGKTFGFGGSIPLGKARSPEVLLATHLNDRPLPPVHGFPLRLVVPGWIGARSVKWLGRIRLRTKPSVNYFQTRAYRLARTVDSHDHRDVAGGVPLSKVSINAVILHPRLGQTLQAGPLTLRGWAIGEGARPLASIEVSSDGGENWIPARWTSGEEEWAWRLWEATLTLRRGHHSLVARTTDVRGRSQPAALLDTWNVKGYSNNAWHRVPIVVE